MSTSTVTGSPVEPELPRGWAARVAGALTHRNFRLLWLAALGSTIGTWMQKYAQGLVVFDMTKSKFFLGLDDFLGQLPILLLMLIGGVIADRHDRRRLLTGSQYVQAFSAFALAILYWTHHITVWHIFALSFVSGCGQAFGGPAYQSMIPSLVPRRDLPNAIALNSTQFNLSRVLGPGAGAAVLAAIGAAGCFAVNGISFFFVVIALAALKLPPHQPVANRQPLGAELKSGLHYVRDNNVMFTLTWLVVISTFLAMPILTMLPAFASEVLTGAGSHETRLSLLMGSQGLGAILGALIVGGVGTTRHMGKLLLGVQIGLGLLIAAFSLSTSLPLSLVLLFLGGMFFMALFSISFSLVQLTVPDALRGRVVSIYMVALRGGGPIGGLAAGALADQFSASSVMAANGFLLAIIAGSLLFFKRGSSLNAV
ncbi:MAG: MFS transporter [Vicinamibacterales bacterium]